MKQNECISKYSTSIIHTATSLQCLICVCVVHTFAIFVLCDCLGRCLWVPWNKCFIRNKIYIFRYYYYQYYYFKTKGRPRAGEACGSCAVPSLACCHPSPFPVFCSVCGLMCLPPPITLGAVGYLGRKDTHKTTWNLADGSQFCSMLTFRLMMFSIDGSLFPPPSASNWDHGTANTVGSSCSASLQM